jgi:uncharacterized protein (TIGR03435 family)
MKRSICTAAIAAILITPVMLAVSRPPQVATTFEVASIKPFKDSAAGMGAVMIGGGCRGIDSAAPGGGGPPPTQMTVTIGGAPPGGGGAPPRAGTPFGGRVAGPPGTPIGRCVYTRMTLKMLINAAYRLTALGGSLDQLLIGGPSWISTDAFDIDAKAEDTAHTTQDQLRVMLQNLLSERFKLKFHREPRETQGFDLVIAKGGLKMKEASGSEPGGMSMSMGNPAAGGMSTVNAQGSTMASIVGFLSGRLGRAIQDKTGLTGKYNFTLKWTPGENESMGLGGMILRPPAPATPEAADPGVSIFTALQEQLGLRLESSKVTVDAMVVESAEKPEQQ